MKRLLLWGWVSLVGIAAWGKELNTGRAVVDLSGRGWTADGEPVSVPHTWNAWDGCDGRDVPPGERFRKNSSGAESYVRKAVVYRRGLPLARPGKRYFLRFGGASTLAEARVNGHFVGRHSGAFTAFAFEITDALRSSGTNELEVTVDNRNRPDVLPVNADFTMYGGLYRGVELIETDRICISPLSGGSGVCIFADAKTGAVEVRVSVLGGTNEVKRFAFPQPTLWSPETPHLYSVEITVEQGGCRDSVRETFGFRTVEFREDGFYLNGVRRKLRGVNRHQDRWGKGWALAAEDDELDVALMKEMGADAVRTAHYPQSERVYSLCDRRGLLAWCETPCVNGLRFTSAFKEAVWRETREMVDQLGNHPSIFCWSIFNELYNKVEMQEGQPEAMMEELRDYVRSLDPTRPVVAASDRPEKRRLNDIPDALAFNRYPGWYAGDATDMRRLVDEVCEKNGRRILAISEYGAGGSAEQHDDPLKRPVHNGRWHPAEYQAYVHRETYRALVADARIWGSFVWCLADFGSDCRQEGPSYGVNDKGLVSFDRAVRKDAFWLYKANWADTPVLHLVGADSRTITEEKVNVLAFSNVGAVELRVNGRSIGMCEPDEVRSVLWRDVPLAEGTNVLEAVAGKLSVRQVVCRTKEK